MNNKTIYFSILIVALLSSCNDESHTEESNKKVDPKIEQEVKPLCSESNEVNTLRLEVKCESCEVKYSLMTDDGNKKKTQKVKGIWCKELSAQPTDIVGLFATKLENGEPIEFTLESTEYKKGVEADTVEVRTYYNNQLIERSDGNGYAGISMLEIP